MSKSKISKWAKESEPKKVDFIAWVLALISLGCYYYMGTLIVELLK